MAQAVGTALGEGLGGHVEAVAGGRAGVGAELHDVVAVDVVGAGVACASEQVLQLVHAGATDVGAAALGVAVDHAERGVAHQRADLAGHHGYACDGVRAAAGDSVLNVGVDQLVGLVPADLLPARILVEALLRVVRFIGLVMRLGS